MSFKGFFYASFLLFRLFMTKCIITLYIKYVTYLLFTAISIKVIVLKGNECISGFTIHFQKALKEG
ncbi:hypothetical protein A3844_26955 [Paenibacillus helianthi]|uniref:Uncharacterized protein n=1 Tax=Paenibacillus helianthi TaxID=1349432 RepID=A0ABX3EFY3_9BACL|nr:hypothetical protein A3844_26955 [Paenibacillus helianthi]